MQGAGFRRPDPTVNRRGILFPATGACQRRWRDLQRRSNRSAAVMHETRCANSNLDLGGTTVGVRTTSWLIFAVIFSYVGPLSAQGTAGPGYHKAQEIVLGGEGGWDYLTLDAVARRLYISRATQVVVVDPDLGKVIGTISDTPGVHGIAVAGELGTGYTSNGRDGTVTVFDLRTLRQRARITVGTNPDAIIYEPATKRVFTFNGGSHDASVIDARTGSLVNTLPLDGRPEFAVADGHGNIYLNLEDKSELVKIDASRPSIEGRWALAPCERPTGISMDVQRRRLFVGCLNRLMVIVAADQGRVIATVPIGAGSDATAFDAQANLAFSSNADGTLTVVREDGPDRFGVENVATKTGARTMAIDPQKQRIYLVTAEFGPRPAPTAEQPNPRPPILPGTFSLLVLAR
jgi:DNA-binding beta-propeller fold protein YncE